MRTSRERVFTALSSAESLISELNYLDTIRKRLQQLEADQAASRVQLIAINNNFNSHHRDRPRPPEFTTTAGLHAPSAVRRLEN